MRLLSIFEKIPPIGVFFVEDAFLLWSQFLRVIAKKVEYRFSIKGKQMLAYIFRIIYPIDLIAGIVFIKIKLPFHTPQR